MNPNDSYGRVKRSLLKHGRACFSLVVIAQINGQTLAEADALALKHEVLAIAKNDTLSGLHGLNLTIGGEGASQSEEQKQLLRPARAEKMRNIQARTAANGTYSRLAKERQATTEFRARSRARALARYSDPATAAAHLDLMKRVHANPEFAAARDNRFRRLKKDPEFRAKNLIAITASNKDPALKKKRAEAMAMRYVENPELRAHKKAVATAWTLDKEYVQKRKDGLAKRYSDPKNVESHAAKTKARHASPSLARSACLAIHMRWAKKHAAAGKQVLADKQVQSLRHLFGQCGSHPDEQRMKNEVEAFLSSLSKP